MLILNLFNLLIWRKFILIWRNETYVLFIDISKSYTKSMIRFQRQKKMEKEKRNMETLQWFLVFDRAPTSDDIIAFYCLVLYSTSQTSCNVEIWNLSMAGY